MIGISCKISEPYIVSPMEREVKKAWRPSLEKRHTVTVLSDVMWPEDCV